jgi:hypothetical protein
MRHAACAEVANPTQHKEAIMSHFEYVAVAFSLVFALILARLLEALPAVFDASRRYWVHYLWVLHLVFSVLGVWWDLWGFRESNWTPVLFLEVMSFPMILYMRTLFLLQDRGTPEKSWDDLYYENRVPFFMASALAPVGALAFNLSVMEPSADANLFRLVGLLLVLSLSVAGIASRERRVHAGIAIVSLVLSFGWLLGGAPR